MVFEKLSTRSYDLLRSFETFEMIEKLREERGERREERGERREERGERREERGERREERHGDLIIRN